MKYLNLFKWFDRPEDGNDVDDVPPIITRERARKARLYLNEHSGFDFERFRRTIQVDQLLNEPLGGTSECLSAEDIASLVGSRSTSTLDYNLVARAVSHSATCSECFDNIALYQQLENWSVTRATYMPVRELLPSLSIGEIGLVDASRASNPSLGLAVIAYGARASELDAWGTLCAEIAGPFEAKEVPLHRVAAPEGSSLLDSTQFGFRQAPWKEGEGLIQGYYRTGHSVALGQLNNQMCSYVSISKEIGGRKEVLGSRVIRLERG
jgi:hypothetical protein